MLFPISDAVVNTINERSDLIESIIRRDHHPSQVVNCFDKDLLIRPDSRGFGILGDLLDDGNSVAFDLCSHANSRDPALSRISGKRSLREPVSDSLVD